MDPIASVVAGDDQRGRGSALAVRIEDLFASIEKGGHKSIERFLIDSHPYGPDSGVEIIAGNGTKYPELSLHNPQTMSMGLRPVNWGRSRSDDQVLFEEPS